MMYPALRDGLFNSQGRRTHSCGLALVQSCWQRRMVIYLVHLAGFTHLKGLVLPKSIPASRPRALEYNGHYAGTAYVVRHLA